LGSTAALLSVKVALKGLRFAIPDDVDLVVIGKRFAYVNVRLDLTGMA